MYSVQYLCYSCKELLVIDVLRLPGLLITSCEMPRITLLFFFFFTFLPTRVKTSGL